MACHALRMPDQPFCPNNQIRAQLFKVIREYSEFFCWKNVSSFCSAKATHIFSAKKNIRILYIESAKTVNEITLNELVKLTTPWTTGPRSFIARFQNRWILFWRIGKFCIRLCEYTSWCRSSLFAYEYMWGLYSHDMACLGPVKRKSSFEHAQNVWIHIIMHSCAVSFGHLLSTGTRFYSIQRFCLRTEKALIRLCGCAGWSGPSLSAYAQRRFPMIGTI